MRIRQWISVGCCVAALGMWCGCNGSNTADEASTADSSHSHDDHGHDHGHDHSHDHGEHHGQIGPHDGHLIELGSDDFHAELAHAHDSDEVTIYILDSAAENSVAAAVEEVVLNLVVDDEPKQYTFAPEPMEGETADQCSRFVLDDSGLSSLLAEHAELDGRINLTVAGVPLVGDFHHHAHDHEGHDHGHDDHDHDDHDHNADHDHEPGHDDDHEDHEHDDDEH